MAKKSYYVNASPRDYGKATLAAAETLCRLEDEGFAEVQNLRHLRAH